MRNHLVTIIFMILCGSLNSLAQACSQHGTNAGNIDWLSTGGSGGVAQGVLILETSLVAPTVPTTCTAGVGLGSLGNLAPVGLNVTDMSIVVINNTTGSRVPLPAFSFAPNSITSAALTAGSGSSSLPNTIPLFDGSTWFGFSSDVTPFTLPGLGPDEFTAFQFTVELPATLLPLRLESQFAGGEGEADGTPIFDGAHPVQYFTAANTSVLFTAQVPEPNSLALASFALLCGLATRPTR